MKSYFTALSLTTAPVVSQSLVWVSNMSLFYDCAEHIRDYTIGISVINPLQNEFKLKKYHFSDSVLIGLTLSEDIDDRRTGVGTSDTGLLQALEGTSQHASFLSCDKGTKSNRKSISSNFTPYCFTYSNFLQFLTITCSTL